MTLDAPRLGFAFFDEIVVFSLWVVDYGTDQRLHLQMVVTTGWRRMDYEDVEE